MGKNKALGAHEKDSVPVQGAARGVYADLITPRRANSIEADAAVFLDYLDSVARAGGEGSHVDGLVLFASMGEFIHFDVAERMRAAGLAIRRSRIPVLIGVSHSTLEGALELTQEAVAINAAGVLLMPPYFYPYPENQTFDFYQRFAQESERTLIYLHDSPLSANPMSPELICRLLNTGRFAGIFREQGTSLSTADRGAVTALSGAYSLSLLGPDEALIAGAASTGIVSAIAAALPELPVALYHALEEGEMERSEELRRTLEELRIRLAPFPSVMGLKQAAIARGWIKGPFAVPPDRAMETQLRAFEEWFKGWLPGVLSKCATKG